MSAIKKLAAAGAAAPVATPTIPAAAAPAEVAVVEEVVEVETEAPAGEDWTIYSCQTLC